MPKPINNNIANWLALHRVPGIGPAKFMELLQYFPNLCDIPTKYKYDWQAVDKDLTWSLQEANHIITINDYNYPMLLREISNPPPILFIQGQLSHLEDPKFAMIGSRKASPCGMSAAKKFAKQLAEYGISVVSGLAIGVDSQAHLGALAAKNGRTIAVMAHGLDHLYPSQNKTLANNILERGLLISEFPIGVAPSPSFFPRRNRIISGLSFGVLVIEAAMGSGSLTTVEHAAEQGREVFAMPGNIFQTNSNGCHQLIKDGARLFTSIEDLWPELSNWLINIDEFPVQKSQYKIDSKSLDILSLIDFEVTPLEIILSKSRLSMPSLSRKLLQLELGGYIKSMPGGYIQIPG